MRNIQEETIMASFTTKFFDSHTKQEITDPRELDAHDTYSVSTCDEDGSRVHMHAPGTQQLAHCEKGHRWQETFAHASRVGRSGGWIELR